MNFIRVGCFVMKNDRVRVFNSLPNQFHAVKYRTYIPVQPKTKYGGRYTVTMIAGDGYGPQLMKYVKYIFYTAEVPVEFEEILLDSKHNNAEYTHAAITSIKRNGVAIKGNIHTERDNLKFQSRNVILRTKLDLFANVLHCKSVPGIKTRHKDVDIILIRQNTEGEYKCLEHESIPGVVESLKIVTKERSDEIARFAFEHAVQEGRKKITSVHKANVMTLTDGLFQSSCKNVAKNYPQIEFESIFMDSCCTKLVTQPHNFDVLLLSNLYGNVLNNIAIGLVGGAGVVSGRNSGHECVLFEIGSRSSAILSNPVVMLNASIDLLYYLGLRSHAAIIASSLNKTLEVDGILPHDLGGLEDAPKFVNTVMKYIQSMAKI